MDSVVALERRVASLDCFNSYGLGSALDTVAGPLEIAAMQGEIESRLDFRVNSLASARDAGKTPAISDELLQTKAKEEEVKGNGKETTNYCEEFFELHCFEPGIANNHEPHGATFERDKICVSLRPLFIV